MQNEMNSSEPSIWWQQLLPRKCWLLYGNSLFCKWSQQTRLIVLEGLPKGQHTECNWGENCSGNWNGMLSIPRASWEMIFFCFRKCNKVHASIMYYVRRTVIACQFTGLHLSEIGNADAANFARPLPLTTITNICSSSWISSVFSSSFPSSPRACRNNASSF